MTRREANFWLGMMLFALAALWVASTRSWVATAVNLGVEIERDRCHAGGEP